LMRIVIVGVALAVTLAAAAACGAYRFPNGPSPRTGTVTGQVVAWPCAPVENPQTVCSQRPVADQPVIFTSGSGQDMTTQTDSNGNYAAELPVGTWKVSFKGYMRIISGPESVTIKGGEGVVANYVLDSGIRLPAASPVD